MYVYLYIHIYTFTYIHFAKFLFGAFRKLLVSTPFSPQILVKSNILTIFGFLIKSLTNLIYIYS